MSGIKNHLHEHKFNEILGFNLIRLCLNDTGTIINVLTLFERYRQYQQHENIKAIQ